MSFPEVPPGDRTAAALGSSETPTAPGAWHYLPHALIATLATVIMPIAVVAALQLYAGLDSQLVAIGLALALSLTAVTVGADLWKRQPGGRDLLFGDLMLWGWTRRVRTERQLAETTKILGRGGTAGLDRGRQVEVLEQLASELEARDSYTHGHSRRVARHAQAIAKGMGLSATEIAKVRTAAAVHDVGKIETPREVLNKPGKLTDEEFGVIKRHPVDGAEMVAALGDPEITAMVRHHHERLDGAGYPDGLAGTDIPLGARIIAVADTFDALTSTRAYRSPRKQKLALEILSKESGEAARRRGREGVPPVLLGAQGGHVVRHGARHPAGRAELGQRGRGTGGIGRGRDQRRGRPRRRDPGAGHPRRLRPARLGHRERLLGGHGHGRLGPQGRRRRPGPIPLRGQRWIGVRQRFWWGQRGARRLRPGRLGGDSGLRARWRLRRRGRLRSGRRLR